MQALHQFDSNILVKSSLWWKFPYEVSLQKLLMQWSDFLPLEIYLLIPVGEPIKVTCTSYASQDLNQMQHLVNIGLIDQHDKSPRLLFFLKTKYSHWFVQNMTSTCRWSRICNHTHLASWCHSSAWYLILNNT